MMLWLKTKNGDNLFIITMLIVYFIKNEIQIEKCKTIRLPRIHVNAKFNFIGEDLEFLIAICINHM